MRRAGLSVVAGRGAAACRRRPTRPRTRPRLSAAEIGERCGDADLIACARHDQGRIRIQQGQVEKGLALLDEVMVAVTAGELSSLVTGLMYCSVIQACQEVYAFGRAREWTAALAQWCEEQPEMVAFTGVCRVHRAEIMQLRGAWQEAIEEAQRARERAQGVGRQAAAAALYQQAEVHRLRGEFAAAEEAYRSASQWGLEPQPGLALLRLAQGRTDAAVAAIRRAVGATADRLQRTKLLPAHIEIALAVGNIRKRAAPATSWRRSPASFDTGVLGAMAAHARGAVELAEGDPHAALGSLRRAFEVWQQVEAPYAAARVRVLIGLACRALGDDDGGGLELDAARAVFEQLGAAPDLARIDALIQGASSVHRHGLTPRELQVLRQVAAGKTNKAIAAELCLSEKTDRPACEQHLHQARRRLAGRGHGLRVRAQADLIRRGPPTALGGITHAVCVGQSCEKSVAAMVGKDDKTVTLAMPVALANGQIGRGGA